MSETPTEDVQVEAEVDQVVEQKRAPGYNFETGEFVS